MWERFPVGEEEVEKTNMALAQEKNYTTKDIEALPEHVRAELIDGRLFYMAAPPRAHQELLGFIHGSIWHYLKIKKAKCKVYPAPFAVMLDNDDKTWLEPDVVVVCDPQKLDDKGCHGAPDLVVEILSPSTRSRDCLLKMNKYQAAKVREYWIVDPDRGLIQIFDFAHETVYSYSLKDKVAVGIFEDLELDFGELAGE